jgi:hypothetical protein
MIVREFGNGIGRRLDRFGFQAAGRRHRFIGCERLIVPIERRAIWTDKFRVVTHIAEYVRMIERGRGANAHEFRSADLDDGNPKIVVKMRNYPICHVVGLLAADGMHYNGATLRFPPIGSEKSRNVSYDRFGQRPQCKTQTANDLSANGFSPRRATLLLRLLPVLCAPRPRVFSFAAAWPRTIDRRRRTIR